MNKNTKNRCTLNWWPTWKRSWRPSSSKLKISTRTKLLLIMIWWGFVFWTNSKFLTSNNLMRKMRKSRVYKRESKILKIPSSWRPQEKNYKKNPNTSNWICKLQLQNLTFKNYNRKSMNWMPSSIPTQTMKLFKTYEFNWMTTVPKTSYRHEPLKN